MERNEADVRMSTSVAARESGRTGRGCVRAAVLHLELLYMRPGKNMRHVKAGLQVGLHTHTTAGHRQQPTRERTLG